MLNSHWQPDTTPFSWAPTQLVSLFASSPLLANYKLRFCTTASARPRSAVWNRRSLASSRCFSCSQLPPLGSGKGALSLLNSAQRSIASPPISTLNPPRPEPQPQPFSQRPPRHRPRLVCFARSPLLALFSDRYPTLSSICGAPTTRFARFNAPFSFSPAARLYFSLVTRHGRSDKRQRRALSHRRAHR